MYKISVHGEYLLYVAEDPNGKLSEHLKGTALIGKTDSITTKSNCLDVKSEE